MKVIFRFFRWLSQVLKRKPSQPQPDLSKRLDRIDLRLDKLSKFFGSAGGHRSAGKKLRALMDPEAFYEEQAKHLQKVTKEAFDTELKSIIGTQFMEAIKRYKGEIGEIVVYGALERDYRFVIPVGRGQPIDFIGIGDQTVDFIEVKTGGKSLSKREKELEKAIADKKTRFILYTVKPLPETLDQRGEDEFLQMP